MRDAVFEVIDMPLLRSLLLLCCASPLPAQNLLFEERFDQGIPRTWSQIQLGFGSDIWFVGTNPVTANPDVYHEYFCNHGTLFRDNRLVTPALDLRGLTDALLTCDDYQALPTWRLRNAIEVSVAGGPWVTLFEVTRTTSGAATIAVDLGAYVGRAGVRLAFHYQGDIANEWRLDNVRVTTSRPVHAVDELRSNRTATFSVEGAQPGNLTAIYVSLQGGGPLPAPFGLVHLSWPIELLSAQFADPQGRSSIAVPIPRGLPGLPVWSQALEFRGAELVWSNALALEVR
jgi:hypothetical protein